MAVSTGTVWRTFWLRTAASYQLKFKSGLEAYRPSVRSVSARRASSKRNMYRSLPLTSARTLMLSVTCCCSVRGLLARMKNGLGQAFVDGRDGRRLPSQRSYRRFGRRCVTSDCREMLRKPQLRRRPGQSPHLRDWRGRIGIGLCCQSRYQPFHLRGFWRHRYQTVLCPSAVRLIVRDRASLLQVPERAESDRLAACKRFAIASSN